MAKPTCTSTHWPTRADRFHRSCRLTLNRHRAECRDVDFRLVAVNGADLAGNAYAIAVSPASSATGPSLRRWWRNKDDFNFWIDFAGAGDALFNSKLRYGNRSTLLSSISEAAATYADISAVCLHLR